MKNFFLQILLLAASSATAQNFVKVIDPANPIANFTTAPVHGYVGAAWVDFDDDGDVDLFAAPDKLFENLGSGNFQPKTHAIGAGIVPGNWTYAGTSWADVDNDGDLDCFLAYAKSRLYLNDGAGVFTEVTTAPLDANNSGWAGPLGDYNGDQIMDIAITNPFSTPGAHGFIFSSSGNLNWQSITGLEFTDNASPYTTAAWADFDDDGDFDLFIAAGPAIQPPAAPDFIYRNQLAEMGVATLERITDPPFASMAQDGQSYAFIDYDNDGHLDICLASYKQAPNRLYHNNGDGTWTSVATDFTATSLTNCLSNAWGDFDNDGDLDVIFTRDSQLPARLFTNDGQGNFTLDANSAISQHIISTGASVADYDNDGDLDAFLHGRTDLAGKGRALFRNDLGNGHHWVSFKLIGTESNWAAIGAKVRIKVTISGVSKWLRRDVSAQNTFQGQNDLRAHFGLGDATVIDSLSVWWPSGSVTTCSHVLIDQFHTVTETDGTWELCTTPVSEVFENEVIGISPNPAGSDIFIKKPEAAILEKLQVEIFDLTGRSILKQAFSDKMDVSSLSSGAFILMLSDGARKWQGRFVKN